MAELITPLATWSAAIVEGIGICVIAVSAASALVFLVVRAIRPVEGPAVLEAVRHRLGRGILLGLEFLVAADIIHTVALELTFETVGVLALIVIIRTFLSFTLELEVSGQWPWRRARPHDHPG